MFQSSSVSSKRGLATSDSGVIHQDVDTAKVRRRLIHEPVEIGNRSRRQVGLQRQVTPPRSFYLCLGLGGSGPRHARHVRARFGERLGDAPPDAPAGARDQSDVVL